MPPEDNKSLHQGLRNTMQNTEHAPPNMQTVFTAINSPERAGSLSLRATSASISSLSSFDLQIFLLSFRASSKKPKNPVFQDHCTLESASCGTMGTMRLGTSFPSNWKTLTGHTVRAV
ncbi:hypothetical protein ETB97_012088 [Aspergillus alliaceus]|uniref:Uncharacterized protein n=1 Tax=Petromyces alliaceus TaxID=209559 RepID=A0A8H5ZQV0_PETAA|nr:hypothetical protein ETB97_012088 [Aspergillus burnettii]